MAVSGKRSLFKGGANRELVSSVKENPTEAANGVSGSSSGVTITLRRKRDHPNTAFGFHRHATVSYNTTLEGMLTAKKEDQYDADAVVTTRDLVFWFLDGFPNTAIAAGYPKWMQASVWMERVNIAFIILSVGSIVIETLPVYFSESNRGFIVVEILSIAFFTGDFLLRFICVRDKLDFMRKVRNIIDLVSVLPFFVSLFVTSETSMLLLRLLRMIRILRVLKLSRNNIGLMAVTEAISESSEAITMLFFLLIVALVLFSSLMFYAEQTGSSLESKTQMWMRDDGTISPFQSIFHTMWWCIVTMTTVGYGDHVPVTPLGKIVGCATMLCGVFVLAFPTVILSTNFQVIHQSKVEGFRELQAYTEAQDHAEKRRQDLLRQRQFAEEKSRKSIISTIAMLKATNAAATVSPLPTPAGSGSAPELGNVLLPPTTPSRAELSPSSNSEPMKNVPFFFDPYSHENLERLSHLKNTTDPNFSGGGLSSAGSMPHPVHRKSQDISTAGPDQIPTLILRDECGRQESFDPAMQRDLVVVTDQVAVYSPVLYLRCLSNGHIRAKAETFANNAIVTLQLCIESEQCQAAAEEALRLFRPDIADGATVLPRPIFKMKVHMQCEHPKLKGVRLLCESFNAPLGIVPLSIVLPSSHLVAVLMSNLGCLSIAAWLTFDAPSFVEEPLLHYGGMMLAGTNFDDDEQKIHEQRLIDDNLSLSASRDNISSLGAAATGAARPVSQQYKRLASLMRKHGDKEKTAAAAAAAAAVVAPDPGSLASEDIALGDGLRPGSRRQTTTFTSVGPAA